MSDLRESATGASCSHRDVSAARLLRLDGSEPLRVFAHMLLREVGGRAAGQGLVSARMERAREQHSHAHRFNRTQAAEGGRDGAGELVGVQVAARTSQFATGSGSSPQRTHSSVSAVSAPKLGGSVPVNWLEFKSLQAASRQRGGVS